MKSKAVRIWKLLRSDQQI